MIIQHPSSLPFFFFNDTATTEIYTLSLHDALPISTVTATISVIWNTEPMKMTSSFCVSPTPAHRISSGMKAEADRKSTRLNSSHLVISYAVFCLKKKKKTYRLHSLSHIASYD